MRGPFEPYTDVASYLAKWDMASYLRVFFSLFFFAFNPSVGLIQNCVELPGMSDIQGAPMIQGLDG